MGKSSKSYTTGVRLPNRFKPSIKNLETKYRKNFNQIVISLLDLEIEYELLTINLDKLVKSKDLKSIAKTLLLRKQRIAELKAKAEVARNRDLYFHRIHNTIKILRNDLTDIEKSGASSERFKLRSQIEILEKVGDLNR